MEKFSLWLEMPIRSFNLAGQWDKEHAPKNPKSPSMGYYSDDFGTLTNKNAQEKIKRKWGRVNQEFDIYFVRNKQAARVREVGRVEPEFLKTIGLDIQPNENAVNLIFTNNMGAERMPMNWWTMAHRFGHAIRRERAYEHYTVEFDKNMRKVLQEVYRYQWKYDDYGDNQKMLKNLACAIGTMKSARDRTLRNYFEFHYELLAQYLIEGKVKFNKLPHQLATRFTWGNPQGPYSNSENREDWTERFEDHIADEVNYNLDYCVESCVGKIYVI